MRPQYITIVGGTPKVIGLDSNIVDANISIRTTATVELALENPDEATPVWFSAPPANAAGIIVVKDPARLVRFTSAGDATATILQQGII